MSFIRKIAAVATAAAATAAIGTSAANAAVSVSNSTPQSGDTLSVTVSSPPAGAVRYALALCDTTDPTPANWGNDCSSTTGSATSLALISAGTTKSLLVTDTFTNRSFIPGGAPLYGPTTDCDATGGSDPCAVIASWYDAAYNPVGVDAAPLVFVP